MTAFTLQKKYHIKKSHIEYLAYKILIIHDGYIQRNLSWILCNQLESVCIPQFPIDLEPNDIRFKFQINESLIQTGPRLLCNKRLENKPRIIVHTIFPLIYDEGAIHEAGQI